MPMIDFGLVTVDTDTVIGSTLLHPGVTRPSAGAPDTTPHRSTERVAVRIIPKDTRDEFMGGEGRLLTILHAHPHRNTVRIRACIDCRGPLKEQFDGALVFSPASTKDLHTFLRESNRGCTETLARSLFRQMAEAVAHCHARRVVVGDIKLGKMLFADERCTDVVLADLSSGFLHPIDSAPVQISRGSPAYVAPEVLQRHACDPLAVDVWAMGVCLYIMLTCSYPFFAKEPQPLFEKIVKGDLAFPAWVSTGARLLIRRMLCVDASSRPTMQQVLDDPWLQHGSASLPSLSNDQLQYVGLGLDAGAQVIPTNPAASAVARDANSAVSDKQQQRRQQQQQYSVERQQQQPQQQQQQQQQQRRGVKRRYAVADDDGLDADGQAGHRGDQCVPS